MEIAPLFQSDMTNHFNEPIQLNASDENAVRELVTVLLESGSTQYTVINEYQEDITSDIRKLVSLQRRMRKG